MSYTTTAQRARRRCLRRMLGQSPYIYEYAPVSQVLDDLSARRGIQELTEGFLVGRSVAALKPILTSRIWCMFAARAPPGNLVASKQIYGTIFRSGFDLLSVVDRPRATGPSGTYLVLLRRCRCDI